MDFLELLKFCGSSKYINNSVCLDNTFWTKKLLKDYNLVYDPSKGDAKDQYLKYRRYYSNIYGTISPDGTFRIHNNLRRDERRVNRGKLCKVFPRSELIDVIQKLGITLDDSSIMTKNELCDLIRHSLQQVGKLYSL